MPDVVATRCASYLEMRDGPPGSFYWSTETMITFRCPCGCERMPGVSCAPPHGWKWNGDRDKPTFTPSIAVRLETDRKKNHWHGYLTDGVFRGEVENAQPPHA